MSPELESRLYEKYPEIFRQKDLPVTDSAMGWGIDCGDGWFTIIDLLCNNIQHHLKYHPELKQVEAAQVKEKFGQLCFYTDGSDEYVTGLINMAESISAHTCEICGAPGKTYRKGWHVTRCIEHAVKNKTSDADE